MILHQVSITLSNPLKHCCNFSRIVRKAHNSGRNHLANVRDYYACTEILLSRKHTLTVPCTQHLVTTKRRASLTKSQLHTRVVILRPAGSGLVPSTWLPRGRRSEGRLWVMVRRRSSVVLPHSVCLLFISRILALANPAQVVLAYPRVACHLRV